MSFRRRLKNKRIPEGWELIEEVVEDFEQQMKEAVNEEHEGKRKAECTWKIHRIHWEKNRFIYDLMYVRKVMSRELYDWLVREKVADGALISKWRKPGYELLCSTLAINKGNHNFGTTSHCRVPLKLRGAAQRVTPNVQTGCISCASGDGKFGGPIWWNTPLDEEDEETAEQNRATWGQAGAEEEAGPSGTMAASRKRAYEEEEEELDDDCEEAAGGSEEAGMMEGREQGFEGEQGPQGCVFANICVQGASLAAVGQVGGGQQSFLWEGVEIAP